ncbi:Fe-S cluster assembly protein SufD [Dokdonella sp.]|uniref:Fe-S cluster assembly protein SufD n=1 Tax=Dokdonella sp. TaxID=2291710 RepID=UPI0035281439
MAGGFLEPLLADGAVSAGGRAAWLDEARTHALQQLAREGMPGPRNEAWKYSSLRALDQRRYQRGDAGASDRELDARLFDLPGVDGPCLVFVNGAFRAELSNLPAIDGLETGTISDLLESNPESLQRFLAQSWDDVSEVFARLNTALAADGPVIRVAAGKNIAPVVHVVIAGAAASADLAWHLRGIVELGKGASLKLVEHHVGEAGQQHLGNLLSQVSVGDGARLDMLQIQHAAESSSLVRRTEATLDADAVFHLRSIEAGAQWMRHDLAVGLRGDRAQFVSRGAFALRNRQHSDTRLDVRHAARDTACDIVWRGVADQRSRGVFHGAITVAPGADGSDAQLSNKNLLLSEQAEIDTQPVLEIHADEVKAAHGATVGQLDEAALFYLRSRGLSVDEARSMLTLAFCRVAFDSIENDALREHMDSLMRERLPRMTEALLEPGDSE